MLQLACVPLTTTKAPAPCKLKKITSLASKLRFRVLKRVHTVFIASRCGNRSLMNACALTLY